LHYYARWAAHGASQARAAQQLAACSLEALAGVQGVPVGELAFVREALRQIAACRRILKWSYAFGWAEFQGPAQEGRRRFFEYAQGEAEGRLEALTGAVEGTGPGQLGRFAKRAQPREDLASLRGHLAGMTSVTEKYFTALVEEVERGLPAVEGGAVTATPEAAPAGLTPATRTRSLTASLMRFGGGLIARRGSADG